MAWYNPSTWTVVDNLQGQNRKSSANPEALSRSITQNADPNRVATTLNGVQYNFAGDPIGRVSNNSSTSDAALDALRAETARLQAQIAAQPRLPTFDSSAAWAAADRTAASTVNPVYSDNLNRYLKKKNLKINQQKTAANEAKKEIQTELGQTREDIGIGRVRTSEDADLQIGDITANENSFQRQEGRQFDAARAALLGDVADAGLTESGLGQGIVQNATTDRNLASEDQVREFSNAKRDTELFRTRTLADLDTSEVRAEGEAKSRTEEQDRQLRDFIEMENVEEEIYRAQNEAERLMAVNNASQSAYQKFVADRLQQLTNSGARAQDIALFKQIYG